MYELEAADPDAARTLAEAVARGGVRRPDRLDLTVLERAVVSMRRVPAGVEGLRPGGPLPGYAPTPPKGSDDAVGEALAGSAGSLSRWSRARRLPSAFLALA